MKFIAPCLYGVSAAVLAGVALGFAGHGLHPGAARLALALGASVTAYGFWEARAVSPPRRALNGWEWAAIGLFSLFSLRAFLWLVFWKGDEIQVLSPNNLGDLSLHVTYIRELANGEPFWPDNPIFAGAKLTYPIGIDLFHSLLTLAGADLWRSFIWIGLAGALLSGVALMRWGGAFTLAGFLCNGGLAGLAIFFPLRHAGKNWMEDFIVARFADFQAEFAWKSIPLALFVTQRGFLFALPAGLLLLCSWRERFFGPERSVGEKRARGLLPRWGEWLLYSSLPIFHFHTFLFLSALLAVWFVVRGAARKEIMRLVGTAFLPATILVLLITSSFHGPSVLGWKPGWMQDDPDFLKWCTEHFAGAAAQPEADAALTAEIAPALASPPSPWLTRPAFWLINFGALPFLVAALCAQVWRDPTAREERAWLGPALGLFAVCLFVKFAPWEWDNTKLMVWSYLVVLPLLWRRLLLPLPVAARVLACVALFGSGFISLLGGLNGGKPVEGEVTGPLPIGNTIAERSELDAIAHDLRDVSPRARFIAHPNYNHPLLLLGRKVAIGFLGHVWSHGYDWQTAPARLTSILNGEPGWREMAATFDARYLFWGAQEREAYPDSPQPWKTEARLVASGDWGDVYDLTAKP